MTRDRDKQLKSRLHHLHQQAIRTKWRLENIGRTRERLNAEERTLIADAIRISQAIDACEAGKFRCPPVPRAASQNHGGGSIQSPQVVAAEVDSSANHSNAASGGLRADTCTVCGGPTPHGIDRCTLCCGSHYSFASSTGVWPPLSPEPASDPVARERDEE